MAIYHLTAKVFSRAKGQSAVACAAYRRGAAMRDERTGELHNFARKAGIAHSELVIPPDAPAWAQQLAARHEIDPIGASAELWNRVERAEKQHNASVAHEVEVALPVELDFAQNVALLRAFVGDQLTSRGLIADWSIHLGKNENIHAHIMLTMRPLTEQGFAGKKVAVIDPATGQPKRDHRNKTIYRGGTHWGTDADLDKLREEWANYQNVHLARAGHDVRVDHRSHAARGIEITPTIHIGPNAQDMRERGKAADRAAEAEAARRKGAREIAERPERVLEMLTEKKAVFTRRDIAREINRYTDDAGAFAAIMARLEASPELVELAPAKGRQPARYSTRTMIADERAMAEAAERMSRGDRHGVAAASLQRAFAAVGLSDEQQKAVIHVAGKAQIAAIAGAAGAGKSTALKAARIAWEAEGCRVRGAAFSGKAARGLQNGSGIVSQTAYSLEWAWSQGKHRLGARDVLVIDEAGMLGSRQLGRLLAEAERGGAKVVLVGDDKQLQPIEAGAGFRAIVERIGHAPINTIRRQKEHWAKVASEWFAKGEVPTALDAYAQRGHIGFQTDRETAKGALARDWLKDRQAQPEASALILAHTNADIRDLNEMIREARRAGGELVDEAAFQTERGERWFAAGDRLVFLRNDRKLGVMNGTLGTVEAARPGRLTVCLDDEDGREGKGPRVEVEQGAYADLDHGYAVTVHKSQGATVDRAYLLASGGMDRHMTYVGMTRHRETARLYAGRDEFANLAVLQFKLSRRRAKETTLDYAERRGIDTPRDWLEDARARFAALTDLLKDAVSHWHQRVGALWRPRPLKQILAAPPPPMEEILAAHQAKQNHSALERGTLRPGAAQSPDQRNDIAPTAAPSAKPKPGRPPAMSPAEVARLAAQEGPEKAWEAARNAESRAVRTRVERLWAQTLQRQDQVRDVSSAHWRNKPQEPKGWRAAVGLGRAKYEREQMEWERREQEIQAALKRWKKRAERMNEYRDTGPDTRTEKLVDAKVERHHPGLTEQGKQAQSERQAREKAEWDRQKAARDAEKAKVKELGKGVSR